ncbi:MAG: ClpX C4-type zinc finger protein [Mycobacteriales bacterium]
MCCSFCARDKDAVDRLIAGPGVYVCSECVDLSNRSIAGELVSEVVPWRERPDDELLASLAKIQAGGMGALRGRGVTAGRAKPRRPPTPVPAGPLERWLSTS